MVEKGSTYVRKHGGEARMAKRMEGNRQEAGSQGACKPNHMVWVYFQCNEKIVMNLSRTMISFYQNQLLGAGGIVVGQE